MKDEQYGSTNEELFSLLTSIQDILFELDEKYRVINIINADNLQLFMLREAIIGKKTSELFPEGINSFFTDAFKKAFNSGERLRIEYSSPSGKKWYESSIIFKKNQAKEGKYIVGIHEITEKKKLQEELKEKTEELERFFHINLDLLCIADLQGNFIKVNKSWEDILGFSKDDLEKRKFFDFVHPDDIDDTYEAMSKLGDNEKVLYFVNRYKSKDGSYKYIEWCSQPYGNLIYAAARDITGTRESEMRLKLSTKGGGVGLWDWDLKDDTVIMNDQWANILGYSLEEFGETSFNDLAQLIHPGDLKEYNKKVDKYLSKESDLLEAKVRMKHKNGQWVWVFSRGQVMEWDEEGSPSRVVGTNININELKLAEKAVERKEKLLIEIAWSIEELIRNHDYFDAIEKCLKRLGEAAELDRVCLFTNNYDEDGNSRPRLKFEWGSGFIEPLKGNNSPMEYLLNEFENFMPGIEEGKTYYGIVSELDKVSREVLEAQGILSAVALPIFANGVFWGFLRFDDCQHERKWTKSEISKLTAFRHSIEKTIERRNMEKEIKQANDQMRILASTDPLTKLINRREMMVRIEHEKNRFGRNRSIFTVIYADIDNFKRINDNYGHNCGDKILFEVGKILQSNIRRQDSLARWGGEEFLLLLPDTNLKGGMILAEKLRKTIEGNVFTCSGNQLNITITLGVSSCSGDKTVDDIINIADRALNEGKKTGKNKVVSEI